MTAQEKIPIGISSCLLGERVRYDGGHKLHSYITNTLGEYFEFRPFCPELDIGLGVPRKPIHLSRTGEAAIRCVAIDNEERDLAPVLRECADRQRGWQQQMCGYIVKNGSPSCGMTQVEIWSDVMPVREGRGIYTAQLMQNLPHLPIEEEGRLGDVILRENFIQRVIALHRWHAMIAVGLSVSALMEFHARHKLVIMSHDQLQYRALGRLVADTNSESLDHNAQAYLLQFMQALKTWATRGNHVNVLQHIQGYLKQELDKEDKQELAQAISNYRQGLLPLMVPITLLNHHFRRHPNSYIANSWYMKPYPAAIKLQNEILPATTSERLS